MANSDQSSVGAGFSEGGEGVDFAFGRGDGAGSFDDGGGEREGGGGGRDAVEREGGVLRERRERRRVSFAGRWW